MPHLYRFLAVLFFGVALSSPAAAQTSSLAAWSTHYESYIAGEHTPTSTLHLITTEWGGFRELLLTTQASADYRDFVLTSMSQRGTPAQLRLALVRLNHNCPVGEPARQLCDDMREALIAAPNRTASR